MHPAEIPFERGGTGDALCDRRIVLNNAQFAGAVRSVARQLREFGVGRGDVVASMLPNRVDIILAMFAAWQLRAAFTPLNPALTSREAAFQLADSRACCVIADRQTAPVLQGASARLLQVEVLDLHGAAAAQPSFALGDIALIIYTSGTTGRPKGVLLDHSNIAAMTAMIVQALGMSAADRAFLFLPLYHCNALVVSALAPLLAGGSTVIADRFDRKTFWNDLAVSGATYFSGVPPIYILLNQLERSAVACEPKGVRFAVCGAAPMPPAAIGEFETRYGIPLLEGYGLTESTVGASLNPLRGPRKAGAVGLPLPGVEIDIWDDAGHAVPRGSVGEVALRGANVMRGYLGLPEETASAIHAGWLRTGDVGRLDPEGYLWLVDRKKDVIIRGGENIYPKEVEIALCHHPAVEEAAVVGRRDAVMGEEPVAFVVLRADMSASGADLLNFLRDSLAATKLPQEIRIVSGLPKNAVGKVSKPALRATVAQGRPC